MIKVSVHRDSDNHVIGVRFEGHAGFAERGEDIVCAAVSVLVINTLNSIETFTSDTFEYENDEKKGMVDFRISGTISDRTELLLGSLLLGVTKIQEDYGKKFIRIVDKVKK